MAERAALPAAATRAAARPALPPRRPPPFTAARRSCSLVCRAGRPPVPTLFDDLTAPGSSSGGDVNSFDDLLRQQMQAMERAQAELSAVSREMDARFAQAQQTAQQAAQQQQGRGGPCGYRWHSSVERSGPGGMYREYRSESFTIIGVPPGGRCGMMHAPPAAAHLGGSLWLVLVAALAGAWAAGTAAFNRGFALTPYKEQSRWALLLLWPFYLLASPHFRQHFLAAVRGRRPPASGGAGTAGDGVA